jgi:large subunit ribosomal protein L24
MKIKKGDNVIVISGKDKGKHGKVSRSFPVDDKVVVEGINIKKRHKKGRSTEQKGQIIEFSAPIHVSNLMIKDPKTGKPTRVGFKTDGKKKIRVSKRSGVEI